MKAIYRWIDYLVTNISFVYKTRIYPCMTKHYWCKFYDWYNKTEKKGWYVLDRHGELIPWIHFDKHSIICLYSGMFTPIEK